MDQNWPRLSDRRVCCWRHPPTAMQLQAFSASGQLLLEAQEQIEGGSHMICACTGTTSTALREAHNTATPWLGCSSSRPRELFVVAVFTACPASQPSHRGSAVAKPAFISQRFNDREAEADRTRAAPWRVGEHLVVEVLIDGRWVSRQYTLTNGDSEHYELGIKREENGIVSTWRASRRATWCASASRAICCLRRTMNPPLYLVAGSVSLQRLPACDGCPNSARSRWPIAGAKTTRPIW